MCHLPTVVVPGAGEMGDMGEGATGFQGEQNAKFSANETDDS